MKYLIVAFVLFGVIVASILTFVLSRYSKPAESSFPEVPANNLFTSLDKIDINDKVATDIQLDNIEPLREYKSKKEFVRLQAKNFAVVGFAGSETGDQSLGGGCMYSSWSNYIKYNNNYYEFSMENLYNFVRPDNVDDFIIMVNIYHKVHDFGCGTSVLLYDNRTLYLPAAKGSGCDQTSIDVGMKYDEANYSFTYFIENITYPLVLSKVTLQIKGDTLVVKNEEVFTCKGGITT